MKRYLREISVALCLVVLLLALAIFAPHFFTPQPMLARLTAQMPALVATIGMTVIIICRQIDISIGSQFGMCAVVAGLVAAQGNALPVVLLASIGTGALLGAFNGVLVAWLRLPSIVVTLATMVTWAETLRLWQQGRLLDLPAGVKWLGLSQVAGQASLIVFALALLIFAAWAMRNLAAGRHVYAVGTDAEAARLAGINPVGVTFGAFVLMGVLIGVAAVMNVSQSPQVQPTCGEGLELKVIAACVVGGVAVRGGRGNLWGVLAGFLLLANVNPALTHFHAEAYWEKAIQGLVILLAVVAEGVRSKRK